MIPVMPPTPATGAVAVKFDAHSAISTESDTVSRFAPLGTQMGRPATSTQNVLVA